MACIVIIPLILPIIVKLEELMLPVTDKLVPVAVPITGVTKVGLIDNTLLPEPVLVVTPVPPFNTGKAIPESVSARVPELVIGEPETDKKVGTVSATEVTTFDQVIAVLPPACEVNTCPAVPAVIGKL
jgi:hypothetical protein